MNWLISRLTWGALWFQRLYCDDSVTVNWTLHKKRILLRIITFHHFFFYILQAQLLMKKITEPFFIDWTVFSWKRIYLFECSCACSLFDLLLTLNGSYERNVSLCQSSVWFIINTIPIFWYWFTSVIGYWSLPFPTTGYHVTHFLHWRDLMAAE